MTLVQKQKWLKIGSVGLTVLSVSLLFIALSQPFIRITKLMLFNKDTSLLKGFFAMFEEGEWLLLLIVLMLTVVLPLCKIITYGMLPFVVSALQSRLLNVLNVLSKWAMLDVFVVAILVVTVKLGALAQVSLLPGFYWFIATLFSSYLLAFWVQYFRQVESNSGKEQESI
ncbi:paraquat-inducible protein A [Marinicellulosiphila megalodicopiae]|uniref:paraquat-inducible protein A n=1 Tax=Marinicellulosiphila megalodicopiae TaxID=2724896 RepID=UPI003BAF6B29